MPDEEKPSHSDDESQQQETQQETQQPRTPPGDESVEAEAQGGGEPEIPDSENLRKGTRKDYSGAELSDDVGSESDDDSSKKKKTAAKKKKKAAQKKKKKERAKKGETQEKKGGRQVQTIEGVWTNDNFLERPKGRKPSRGRATFHYDDVLEFKRWYISEDKKIVVYRHGRNNEPERYDLPDGKSFGVSTKKGDKANPDRRQCCYFPDENDIRYWLTISLYRTEEHDGNKEIAKAIREGRDLAEIKSKYLYWYVYSIYFFLEALNSIVTKVKRGTKKRKGNFLVIFNPFSHRIFF